MDTRQLLHTSRPIFEQGKPGRSGASLPACDVPVVDAKKLFGDKLRKTAAHLPEVSEVEVTRHYTRLSRWNYAIDIGLYPLGSCTMKYNPKVNEDVARMPGIARVHPLQPDETVQGALRILFELQSILAEITGFRTATLQPSAGAQGELVGMLMMRAYHRDRGDTRRTRVLVPDSAHGTNPATAAMCGFSTVAVPTDAHGNVDLGRLQAELDETVVGLMLTNPNTLGLFEQELREVTAAVHQVGGLVYGDGANLNAILGVVKPAEMGFDCLHINVHKTFSTPHGSGGPGAGPVAVSEKLEPYLPVPMVIQKTDGSYALEYNRPKSIGRLKSYQGHFGILARAYTYIRMHGPDGLREISETAVLNANYLKKLLEDVYEVAYDRTCMHEFVLTARRQKAEHGVKTLDIAKRLLDFGIHPPTIYFPLIVEEAIMVEPTEGESRQTLEHFSDVMHQIAREIETDPELVLGAPREQVVGRLDEVTAARRPILRWT
ncbi:MAG: aminomethyl-transferring glycine dehydrogenase subunit GcvPB [Chloroflexi bacterium]|nr:aminomethyl-transferring glycine dehydrogenase subunit GcvPB [Chloroflexota bacterium]